jgi:ketosteroid isomerase-like protein
MENSSNDKATPEFEVRAAVARFGQAFLDADVEVLESLLTDDYIHVNGNSGNVLKRNEWLNWIKSRRTELEAGHLIIDEYETKDVAVKIYENVAIVTGTVYSNGKHNGELFASHVRFTNTWVLINEEWRRAAFHDSPLPFPKG